MRNLNMNLKQLKYVCDEKSGGCLQDLRGSNLLSDLYSSCIMAGLLLDKTNQEGILNETN